MAFGALRQGLQPVADLGGGLGGMHFGNDFGRKISLYFEKLGSISGCIPPTSLNLNFGEDLFYFFIFLFFYFFFIFGDHLHLGGKNVRISDFGRKITLNFGEDLFFWRPPDFGRKKRSNFRFRPKNHSQFW